MIAPRWAWSSPRCDRFWVEWWNVSTSSLKGRRAVVIGSGITGLASALVLSRRGADVTVLERDEFPLSDGPNAAFETWQRDGAPQVRHSHIFLGRLRVLLRDHYPDVLAALLEAGARELRPLDRPPPALAGILPEDGDEDLIAMGCRRTTFEWVLRRHILQTPGVKLVSGVSVNRLLSVGGSPPIVTGVVCTGASGDQTFEGDLVIDASGRKSLAPAWLEACGARPVSEESESSGIVYYTRYYRLREGASEPRETKEPAVGDYSFVKFAIFPADDRVFSITLAVPLAEPRLKVLAKVPAFDALVQSIGGLAPWVAPEVSEPIGDARRPVQAMGGLINRQRRFVDDIGPLALRFFALGDAAYCTNPLYGRGCSQGMLHAHFLGEALDAHADDWGAVAMALDKRSHDELDPYYRASILADRDAVSRAEGREPEDPLAQMQRKFLVEGVAVGMRTDPIVFRAFLRMINMFETPEQAFGRPDVIERTLWVMSQGDDYRRAHGFGPPPDRERTIAMCEAAALVA